MKTIPTGLILIATFLCMPSSDVFAGGGFKEQAEVAAEETEVAVGQWRQRAPDPVLQI